MGRRLHTIIMISVTAILLSYSYTARAADTIIFKCEDSKGAVVFQDKPCGCDANEELVIYSEPTDVADAGLRPVERFMLENMYKRQLANKMFSQTKTSFGATNLLVSTPVFGCSK